ncbi:hypothetical protein NUU61_002318 [Penicillium alfredii]|uniref:Cyanovirin-N domain-containing protein n=1 Tax=Penicillium alfredii TaxID=1506179 RepID=A0A9W9KGI5_9EURO|nr:uncharacterized protein NUU61_002318 [Penicillium alfredii]KAJ5104971.1 hypothetical protein NUU61_002318 [Penicillium alfredii]
MHFLKAFLLLLPVTCASRIPSCNDAVKVGDHPPLSKKCSSASIENNWLYAKCDVGADVMTFGLQLNWFIALNPDHKIVFQKDGGAMGACDQDKCHAVIRRGRSATFSCNADNCQGKLDLDKVVNFTGKYLEVYDKEGSGPKEMQTDELDDG